LLGAQLQNKSPTIVPDVHDAFPGWLFSRVHQTSGLMDKYKKGTDPVKPGSVKKRKICVLLTGRRP